jgi:hypothetical protein
MKNRGLYTFNVYFYDIEGNEQSLPIEARCSRQAIVVWQAIADELATDDWRPTAHYWTIEGYGDVGIIRYADEHAN